jgi:hypothetical protein
MVVICRGLRNLKILVVNPNFLQPFSLYRDKVEEVVEFENQEEEDKMVDNVRIK